MTTDDAARNGDLIAPLGMCAAEPAIFAEAAKFLAEESRKRGMEIGVLQIVAYDEQGRQPTASIELVVRNDDFGTPEFPLCALDGTVHAGHHEPVDIHVSHDRATASEEVRRAVRRFAAELTMPDARSDEDGVEPE